MADDQAELIKRIDALNKRVGLLERAVGGLVAGKTSSPPPATAPSQSKFVASTPTAPAKVRTSTELEVGQKWLSVVGIILVFLAALFFVQFAFQFMGPVGRVLLSYAGAALLFGGSVYTKEKFARFSSVLAAGAWGVTYLVTYATHFFPATRIVDSPILAMALLSVVVGALIGLAIRQQSKGLISLSMVLGSLTVILSPLSLFSIVGTLLLLGVLAILALMMPWGDLLLPASISAAVSYVFWYGSTFGKADLMIGPIEHEMIGLIALMAMWLITIAGIMARRDKAQALGGQVDGVTFVAATIAVGMLGLLTLDDLPLVLTTPRLARALWLFLIAGTAAGWLVIAHGLDRAKQASIVAGITATIGVMGSLFFMWQVDSLNITIGWLVFGAALVAAAVLKRSGSVAGLAMVPLLASAIRYIIEDMPLAVAQRVTDLSTPVFALGAVVTIVLLACAALLRTKDFASAATDGIKRIGALPLIAGLIVAAMVVSYEYSGAIPSVMWGLFGLATIAAGFFARWKDARVIGLVALAVTVGRVFLHDLGDLEALPRVISFGILGALLIGLGYAYNHYKDTLQQFLQEEDG